MLGACRNLKDRLAHRSAAILALAASLGSAALSPPLVYATPLESLGGILGLPQSPPRRIAEGQTVIRHSDGGGSTQPHPSVARIVVPEGEATSYGSGTLIDVRDQFGLVVTNWHVVRDGTGEVEVIFPDGFRSKARPLKVDSDWDLAALVIWRPSIEPVKIAAIAPLPGEQLTICGYGPGQYRAITGRCTQYYAPALHLPQHMVELDVEARQGDSGGPIFNARGELAGVLFGASQGTTLGSFAGEVESFLTTLAPDIGGRSTEVGLAHATAPKPQGMLGDELQAVSALLVGTGGARRSKTSAHVEARGSSLERRAGDAHWTTLDSPAAATAAKGESPLRATAANVALPSMSLVATEPTSFGWLEHGRNLLAMVGAVVILLQVLRAVR